MAQAVAVDDPDVIAKGEFAKRRGVSPGRVTQWISEGKIFGAAIVGDGRSAKIRESVAVEQLRQKLDPMQMTGNGLTTNLTPPPAAPTLPLDAPTPQAFVQAPEPQRDSIEERIKQQRLEQIERANRNDKREEALKAGRLVDAAVVRQATGREVAKLISMFEGKLSDFATAISAQFKLPQRDVLHVLRSEFRKARAEVAGDARAKAEALPELVEVDLDEEQSDASDELEPELA